MVNIPIVHLIPPHTSYLISSPTTACCLVRLVLFIKLRPLRTRAAKDSSNIIDYIMRHRVRHSKSDTLQTQRPTLMDGHLHTHLPIATLMIIDIIDVNYCLIQVMYTAIDSKGGRKHGGSIYCLYFVLLTLCGDYTLLNVFLAIACDSLDQAAALNEVVNDDFTFFHLQLFSLDKCNKNKFRQRKLKRKGLRQNYKSSVKGKPWLWLF